MEEWYVTVKDRETRIDRAICRPAYETALATFPKIQDKNARFILSFSEFA